MRKSFTAAIRSVAFVAGALAGCSDRKGDVEEDFTEEVQQICADLCEKVVECRDPPLFETEDECLAVCLRPEQPMYEDSACGEAFRELRKCIGGTANCEEYLDTNNVFAEDYTCKAEGEALTPLMCGAVEGSD